MILGAEQVGEGKTNQILLVFGFFLKAHEKKFSVFSHRPWKAAYFGPIPSCGWDVQRWSNLACITMQVKMLGLK